MTGDTCCMGTSATSLWLRGWKIGKMLRHTVSKSRVTWPVSTHRKNWASSLVSSYDYCSQIHNDMPWMMGSDLQTNFMFCSSHAGGGLGGIEWYQCWRPVCVHGWDSCSKWQSVTYTNISLMTPRKWIIIRQIIEDPVLSSMYAKTRQYYCEVAHVKE